MQVLCVSKEKKIREREQKVVFMRERDTQREGKRDLFFYFLEIKLN